MVQAVNTPGTIKIQFQCPYAQSPSFNNAGGESVGEESVAACEPEGRKPIMGPEFRVLCTASRTRVAQTLERCGARDYSQYSREYMLQSYNGTLVREATTVDSGERCGFVCPRAPGIAELIAVFCVGVLVYSVFVASKLTWAWRWATKEVVLPIAREAVTGGCSADLIFSKGKQAKQVYDALFAPGGGRW